MQREFSDATAWVAGLFVDHAQTEAEAESEAKDTMVQAMSDDVAYWERISSAVLSEELPSEETLKSVEPEFRSFAVHWARYGRSLDVIHSYKSYQDLLHSRFDRKQQRKEKRAASTALRASRPTTYQASWAPYGGGGAAAWGDAGSGATTTAAGLYDEEISFSPPSFDVPAALILLQNIDDAFLKPLDGVAECLPELSPEEERLVAKVFDHMLHCFRHPTIKKRYGFNRNDQANGPLTFRGDVPSYFANVIDQSIWRRKELSMAGLRNLIAYGPTIYKQLRDQLFSGNPQSYRGDVGLNLMRRVTGNVVDLDTTVLRCSCKATLNAINMSNAHKKEEGHGTYRSADEFANSAQAQEIALHCSLPLLEDFAKAMKLTTEAQKCARNISASQITSATIPMATSNTDRGRYPVWHYVNVGQNSFHCNVPTIDDVNGALLKAPFHCARLWATMLSLYCQQPQKTENDSDATDATPATTNVELEQRIEDFFENCIVDACFNLKWKAIEEYDAKMLHEGTIVDVLQKAQMMAQHIFTMEFFDKDDEARSNEKEAMWNVVKGKVAKCVTDGRRMREITREDVVAWVDDSSVSL